MIRRAVGLVRRAAGVPMGRAERSRLLRWTLGMTMAAALAGCASLGTSTGGGAGGGPGDEVPRALDLDLHYGAGRALDLPTGSPDPAADAARAIEAIESRRGAPADRESRPDPTRRPDLDHDVTQGIQSRGLERSIGR
jgi:uncharacterized protein YceK